MSETEGPRGEILQTIGDAVRNDPRSLQTMIGPSELGTPCTRRIAYRMAGTTPVNDRGVAWKPAIGTAVHTFLSEVFLDANRTSGAERWLVERRVDVGEVGGQTIHGSCDLYDRQTGTVVDYKIVGVASLRAKKANGPDQQYRSQFHLYGRGITRQGFPVHRVAMLALPQNGEFSEAYWWSEPYDEQIALDTLSRADLVASLITAGGAAAAAALPTADAFCTYCPYFLPASTEVAEACPGHQSSAYNPTAA